MSYEEEREAAITMHCTECRAPVPDDLEDDGAFEGTDDDGVPIFAVLCAPCLAKHRATIADAEGR